MPATGDDTCHNPACARPRHDGFLCWTCINTLRDLLRDIAPATDETGLPARGLLEDLDTTLSGQARIGARNTGGTGGAGEQGLNPNERAFAAAAGLRDTLLHCVRQVARYHGYRQHVVMTTTRQAAKWLLGHLWSIGAHPEASQLFDAVVAAVATVHSAIDRPTDRAYCGPCDVDDCDGTVTAPIGGLTCRCSTCGSSWDMAERRYWLTTVAEDYHVTAIEASRAVPSLIGRDALSVKTIRSWANAPADDPRHLPVVDYDESSGRPVPLYRCGDIIARAVAAAVRQRKPKPDQEQLRNPALCA